MYASPMPNVRLIPIEQLVSIPNPAEKPEDFEIRVKRIMKLIANGEDLGPFEVRQEGNYYIIGDGRHRFEAMKRLGYKAIPCIGLFV